MYPSAADSAPIALLGQSEHSCDAKYRAIKVRVTRVATISFIMVGFFLPQNEATELREGFSRTIEKRPLTGMND